MNTTIYSYEYEDFLELRKNVLLQSKDIRDYIFVIDMDDELKTKLDIVNKDNISVLKLENYKYIGRVCGICLYVSREYANDNYLL